MTITKQFFLLVFKLTQDKASENLMYFKRTGRSTKAKFKINCERNEATEKGDLKPSPFNFVLTLMRTKLEALKKKKRPLLRNTFQNKQYQRQQYGHRTMTWGKTTASRNDWKKLETKTGINLEAKMKRTSKIQFLKG